MSTAWYDAVIEAGWSPEKIVLGVLTDPQGGAGYIPIETLVNISAAFYGKFKGYRGGFGGVMGWEYAHSISSGGDHEGLGGIDSASTKRAQAYWVERLGHTLRAENAIDYS